MIPAADRARRDATGWTRWKVFEEADAQQGSAWLRSLRLDLFRFLTAVFCVSLALLVVRNALLFGTVSWDDLGNSVFCLVLFFLTSRKPDWLEVMTWLGLAAFFMNAAGLFNWHANRVVLPTHILMPLLVLYAALLGDRWMGVIATLGVLAFYFKTGWDHWPLKPMDIKMLTNLCGSAILIGICTFGVRWQHRRFVEAYRQQAESLRRELDARLQLNAILFHDIKNPLTALVGAAELVRTSDVSDNADLDMIEQMADRVRTLIDSAHEIDNGSRLKVSNVAVGQLWDEVESVFGCRLAAKDQRLTRAGGEELIVSTHRELLCSSVLANIMSNAIKFSPPGSSIDLAAWKEGGRVHMEVRNPGDFPPDVLERGAAGREYMSHAGTDGEEGHAHGLRIAAFCLWRLGGWLEIRRRQPGGTSVAAVLPHGEV